MSLSSMTGFARAEGAHGTWSWVFEAKSVNGRSLEVRLRLPPGLDALEAELKGAAARTLKRGNVQVALSLVSEEPAAPLRLNREALRTIMGAIAELRAEGGFGVPDPAAILSLRGVLEAANEEAGDVDYAPRNQAILKSAETLFADLAASRAREGAEIARLLMSLTERLDVLAESAGATGAAQSDKIRERISEGVRVLIGAGAPLSEDRLAQELALVALRADVREEIDRLKVHIAAARELIASRDAVGRKLDFLSQELNREANTICSKSGDIALTKIGLELKSVIDQFREQIQNVE